MKRYGFVFVGILLAIIVGTGPSRADGRWKQMTGPFGVSEEVTCVEGVAGTDTVYVGTTSGVYVSDDLGRSWQREEVSSFGPKVTGIAVSGEKVFVSADEGLYIKEEKGGKWSNLSGEEDLLGVCFYGPAHSLVTWTRERVFMVLGKEWRDITPRAAAGEIGKAVVSLDTLHISRGGEIYFGVPGEDKWERVTIISDEEEAIEDDAIYGEAENTLDKTEGIMGKAIRDIAPLSSGGVIMATLRGVSLVRGRYGQEEHIDTSGLPSSRVLTAVRVPGGILVATDRKVFFRGEKTHSWKTVLDIAGAGKMRSLKFWLSSSGSGRALAVFSNEVYISEDRFPWDFSRSESFPLKVGKFSLGPDINEVHKMAIDYAEVSPDKIKQWRYGAKWRGILPRLSLKYDENYNDNIEFYKSASTTYMVQGPRERSDGWDFTLTWDLADLIWNSSQTSIDVRSKLMVQLRDDILEDVTRLYFERRRLIKENLMSEDEDPAKVFSRESRIEELTAYVDAYTGGMFSGYLDSHREI